MDTVFIRGLKLETIVGCYAWEKDMPQPIELDIEMAWDNSQAAQTDKLKYALDYDQVVKRVVSHIDEHRFQLVEALVESIADAIMNEFNVTGIRVSLSKPNAIPAANSTGVAIARGVTF